MCQLRNVCVLLFLVFVLAEVSAGPGATATALCSTGVALCYDYLKEVIEEGWPPVQPRPRYVDVPKKPRQPRQLFSVQTYGVCTLNFVFASVLDIRFSEAYVETGPSLNHFLLWNSPTIQRTLHENMLMLRRRKTTKEKIRPRWLLSMLRQRFQEADSTLERMFYLLI